MNKSFTLIEILVVIVIIGILSAFIIVSMAGVSDKATIAKG
ncbi:MAG: prepilin-type N-terminal cleavage/methylation domain-containing protein, partial [Candidatus Paceibacterota bacterium]